jgi:hypothetical protein
MELAANTISRALIYVAKELKQLNTRNRLRKRQYRKAKYPHGRLHSKKKYYNVATSILF